MTTGTKILAPPERPLSEQEADFDADMCEFHHLRHASADSTELPQSTFPRRRSTLHNQSTSQQSDITIIELQAISETALR
jgi:hypothetical protein